MKILTLRNLEMVRTVAYRPGETCDKVVFVGGAIVDLLITDTSGYSGRPTTDVDVIVEIYSRHDYYKLGDHLRSLGFREDLSGEGGPLCRWIIDGIKVDVLPVAGKVFGFSNRFFDAAVETATLSEVADGLTIRLISAPCFLAVKLDAFNDRGHYDYLGSRDMEDFIAVVAGRPEIVDEIIDSPLKVKNLLVSAVAALLKDTAF
jgi:predicted nucleotidyltransferase